jgi:hypothetical protein
MPPTLKLSALVAPDAHLSLVNVSFGVDEAVSDVEADAVLVSLADELGLSLPPQAANERVRMAVLAITFTQVEVLDRFTW